MPTTARRLTLISPDAVAYTQGSVHEPSDPGGAPAAHAPTVPTSDGAASSDALGAGAVLADRYRLLRRLASGGMGAVWEAEHLVLGSKVAIKLIHVAQADDERARTRFLREAQAAAALRTPHVVQIFDYGLHQDTPYIAMELLEGEPLSARLEARGRLEAAEVLELISQVGRAAASAHEAGVVHRDLKPDNIYLVPGAHGEVAKVLDFGIAKRATELASNTTSAGGLLGTPFYMSPEQLIDATTADSRADLWSLAVITYECLVGARPFDGASVPELAVAVLTQAAPIPSRHGAVPAGFDAWFARATKRDPSARFQGAAEMIDALASCLGPTRSASPPLGSGQATPRRSPVMLLAATVVGAAVLAGLALASASGRSEAPAVADEPQPAAVAPALDVAAPNPARARPTSDAREQAPATASDLVPAPAESPIDAPATAQTRRPLGPKPGPRKPKREDASPLHDTAELEPP